MGAVEMGAVREGASQIPGSAGAAAVGFDAVSQLMGAMEERLLFELERRGGRYMGVF
jgi:hypothetical protein